jgi:hypothetical protein
MQALGRITKLPVKVGDVQCLMKFMVVDTDNYNILMGLDFLIKISVVLDVEKGLIEIKQGQNNNVQILPLNMVNMLQLITNKNIEDEDHVQDEPLQLWGIQLLPMEKEEKGMHILENGQPLFDDESNNSSTKDLDEEMKDVVDDEQRKLFL